jgi:hypothetical protein
MPDRPHHPNPGVSPLVVTTRLTGASGNGGPTVVVSSDAMLTEVDALRNVSDVLRLSAGALIGMLDRTDAVGSIAVEVPVAALDARRMMDAALRTLWAAQQRASDIRQGVLHSIETYSRVEQDALSVAHAIDEQVAWGLGHFVRGIALPLGVLAVEGVLIDAALLGMSPGQLATRAQDGLKEHGRILTNPFTVAAIREVAADTDGFGLGFAGLSLGAADALEVGGATGVSTSAGTVVGLGNEAGLLEETPVVVHNTGSFEFGTPPTSLADRANSFSDPHADPNGEQIRIDRYVTPGKPDRFDVYIAGTVTFDPKSGTEPFDFTSDLTGVANGAPASCRAVESAMTQAGITPTSPVVLNGYSQGGLVASLVAASGKYNVKGVVTFGAPSAQVHIPASIPVLSVRNAEDLVPATSGYDVNPNAVVVQRAVFANSPVPTDWAVPAHRLSYYQETAAVVDTSGSSEVRGVLDPLDAFASGTRHVDSTLWVATRVEPGATVGATTGATGSPVRAMVAE